MYVGHAGLQLLVFPKSLSSLKDGKLLGDKDHVSFGFVALA